ncbi:MAG: MarC family protein [Candidatus Eisenbacteria bacterium]
MRDPLLGFLAIMNPLANAPVFLGLTGGMGSAERRTIAIRAVVTAFVIVAAFAVGGTAILKAFGLSVPAVRAFGGLVVAHVGFQLISQARSTAHSPSGGGSPDGVGIAVSPLAVPILAGPGTLATTLSFAAGATPLKLAATLSAFALVCGMTLLGFLLAGKLVAVLGGEFIDAMTKVMGIILGAIGVQMLIAGVTALARAG